jgi:hypothetical protein
MLGACRIHREIVSRIVREEERGANPYASLETLVQKLSILKPHLVALARTDDKCTSYWKLKDDVGIHTTRQGRVLGVLGWHEDELGNSPLPALVEKKNEPMVSDGYFVMVRKASGLTDEIPESEPGRRALWQKHVECVRNEWQE